MGFAFLFTQFATMIFVALGFIHEQERLKKIAAESSDESEGSANAEPVQKRQRQAIKVRFDEKVQY
jgi:hypothetical protein